MFCLSGQTRLRQGASPHQVEDEDDDEDEDEDD
jgi:hypothetical protein